MLASEYLGISVPVQVTTVVVPVAVYFLILGLLNSRKTPQLLTGRQDFALLNVALCPLFVLPVLNALGFSTWTLAAAAVVVAAGIFLLAPRGGNWVVYNISHEQLREVLAAALDGLGIAHEEHPRGLRLPRYDAVLRIGGFPLLRNVSLRLEGGDETLGRRVEEALGKALAKTEAETPAMAVGLLMVATAMIVTPLAFMAPHVPEVVRVLTDLMP